MHIYTCFYMSIHTSTYTRIYVHTSKFIYHYLQLYISMCISVHLSTSLYIYIHLYTSIYIYVNLYTSTYIFICLFAFMCAYISVYIYIYTSVYIFIYIHIYTYVLLQACELFRNRYTLTKHPPPSPFPSTTPSARSTTLGGRQAYPATGWAPQDDQDNSGGFACVHFSSDSWFSVQANVCFLASECARGRGCDFGCAPRLSGCVCVCTKTNSGPEPELSRHFTRPRHLQARVPDCPVDTTPTTLDLATSPWPSLRPVFEF